MRLAVISDIHGNYKAFEAFLDYLEEHPVDGIIGLGDYVTDGPYPQRTMELLYRMCEQYPCVLLRGNREVYLLENAESDQGWKPGVSANGALWYTAQNLTQRDLDFFAGLPEELCLGGACSHGPEKVSIKYRSAEQTADERRRMLPDDCAPLYLCHGTPGLLRGNVTLGEPSREEALGAFAGRYLLGGHSHHQESFCLGDKRYLNPGSLGLAVDGVGGVAAFASMTSVSAEEWDIALHAIPYDLEGFLADFEGSGLDAAGGVLTRAVKKSLRTGRNFFFECVQLAGERGGKALGEIPETIWEEVAGTLL